MKDWYDLPEKKSIIVHFRSEQIPISKSSESIKNDKTVMELERIAFYIRELYATTGKLSALYPGRNFTLDGHLVGGLGEVVAAYRYGLELFTASAKNHDVRAPDGRNVQIKVTQGEAVALRWKPDHLIVLHLSGHGDFTEVFNGPGLTVWTRAGKMHQNRQRPISLNQLRGLMCAVPLDAQIPQEGGHEWKRKR